MLEPLKNLIFNRKRSEEEFKTVYQVLEKINLYTYNQDYAVFPWGIRSKNYEELKKLPGIIDKLQRENESLKREVRTYKEQAETVSLVIDTILDTVEKRYTEKIEVDKIKK